MDECVEGLRACNQALFEVCENRIGSSVCVCPSGYNRTNNQMRCTGELLVIVI